LRAAQSSSGRRPTGPALAVAAAPARSPPSVLASFLAMRVYLFPWLCLATPGEVAPARGADSDTLCKPAPIGLGGVTIEVAREEERHMTRDLLLENLRWLAEGNPKYAGTDEEGRQNIVVAHLMADDFLLSYINDQEVTELFNKIPKG
jgi:hypothetical protein